MIRNPKNDIQIKLKAFNIAYEAYLKGKKTGDDKDIVMSKEDGEPSIGGFA